MEMNASNCEVYTSVRRAFAPNNDFVADGICKPTALECDEVWSSLAGNACSFRELRLLPLARLHCC